MAEDPVLAALIDVARVMHPTVYVPEVASGPESIPCPEATMALLAYEVTHPAFPRAVDAIRGDQLLGVLLGPDSFGGAIINQDTGISWQIPHATHLPAAFVETAARRIYSDRFKTPTLNALLSALRSELRDVRRLVAGQAVTRPALASFEGVLLAEDSQIQTPLGTLRPASAHEQTLRPSGDAPPSLILQSELPLRWLLSSAEAQKTVSDAYRLTRSGPDLVCLAALLAFGSQSPVRSPWLTVLAPLLSRRFETPKTQAERGWIDRPGNKVLTSVEEAEFHRWTTLVATHYNPAIAVAVRRTLSAISERLVSAEDALIDAVVAWESLFGGGGAAETVFRVTSAIALLLAPDAASRSDLRRELAKIYSARSKVIHGVTSGGSNGGLEHLKNRAIDIAVESMRVLFDTRPDLIALNDRGTYLILRDG